MFGGTKQNKPSRSREFTTHINDGTEIEGKITFTGTVLLNGRVRGEITSTDTLVVGERGVVNASIHAGTVEVSGEVVGNITANERIELHPGCRVYGDIEAPVVIIDEGALLEGQCRMTKLRPTDISAPEPRNSGVVPLKRQETLR
ncbi:MAG: polymer-forming cytoskeletal protein [Gemmatimonadaceae bacterium]